MTRPDVKDVDRNPGGQTFVEPTVATYNVRMLS